MPTTTPIQKAAAHQPTQSTTPWHQGLPGKGFVALQRGPSRSTVKVVTWACDDQGLPQAAEVMQSQNVLRRPGVEWAILRVAPDGTARLSDPRGTLDPRTLRVMKAAVEALAGLRLE